MLLCGGHPWRPSHTKPDRPPLAPTGRGHGRCSVIATRPGPVARVEVAVQLAALSTREQAAEVFTADGATPPVGVDHPAGDHLLDAAPPCLRASCGGGGGIGAAHLDSALEKLGHTCVRPAARWSAVCTTGLGGGWARGAGRGP